jgi:hypothetical protein
MQRTLKFTTPVNDQRHLHGHLLVTFSLSGSDIEITKVDYEEAYRTHKRADITWLIQEHAPALFKTLEAMAIDLVETDQVPPTGQKIRRDGL